MRNLNKYILASTLALGTVFTSCEEEVLVPVEDNAAATELLNSINTASNQLVDYNLETRTVSIRNAKLERTLDSLYTVRSEIYDQETTVQYTVNIISGANYVKGRTAGVTGATVTVRQGEYSETKETAAGLAVFEGLQPGYATVLATAPDHTTIEATVYFNPDGQYSHNANVYNAATRILLYPVSGEMAATISGSLYANTTTVNDTLNRTFGYSPVFGDSAGTFIAERGIYDDYNYTQYKDIDWVGQYWNRENIQNLYYNDAYAETVFPVGQAIQFEAAPASFNLYAIAVPSTQPDFESGNGYESGYITNISYSNLIFEATINEDNTYSVTVPASAQGMNIDFRTTEVIANHTRFTDAEIWYYGPGTEETIGSKEMEFTYYNYTDSNVDIYTEQADGTWVGNIVTPGESIEVNRNVITEPYRYEIYGSYLESDQLRTGETEFYNIYLWPTNPGSGSNL